MTEVTFLKGGTEHSSRHGEKKLGIKIGKIQTREFMSRPEIADKVIVLDTKPKLEFFKEDSMLNYTHYMIAPPRE